MATSITNTSISTDTINVDNGVLYVDNNNNRVGVGTSSPTTALNVESSSYPYVRVTNTGYTGLDIGQADASEGGAALIKLRDAADMDFYTADLNRMRISSTGNVGIGTVTSEPQQKLEINTGKLVVRSENASSGGTGNAAAINTLIHLRMPYGTSPGSVANSGARVGIKFSGRNDGQGYDNDSGKSAAIYGVSEDTGAGYTRRMGMAFYTSPFDSSATERMRINNNGIITAPYQPAFQAYNPQGQYITGVTEAAFNSTYSNVGGYYNTSTGRFTAPVSGNYFFHFDGLIDGQTGGHHFSLRKNGIQYDGSEAYHDGYEFNVAKAMVYYLSVGDYVSVYLNSPISRIHQRYGSFCGYLIG